MYVPSVGDLKEFLIMGKGRFEKDQELILECRERALLPKKEE